MNLNGVKLKSNLFLQLISFGMLYVKKFETKWPPHYRIFYAKLHKRQTYRKCHCTRATWYNFLAKTIGHLF